MACRQTDRQTNRQTDDDDDDDDTFYLKKDGTMASQGGYGKAKGSQPVVNVPGARQVP